MEECAKEYRLKWSGKYITQNEHRSPIVNLGESGMSVAENIRKTNERKLDLVVLDKIAIKEEFVKDDKM